MRLGSEMGGVGNILSDRARVGTDGGKRPDVGVGLGWGADAMCGGEGLRTREIGTRDKVECGCH